MPSSHSLRRVQVTSFYLDEVLDPGFLHQLRGVMVSKKHMHQPQYHKRRDLGRLSASADAKRRKQFAQEKPRKHRRRRAEMRTALRMLRKQGCSCQGLQDSPCLGCERLPDQPKISRQLSNIGIGRYPYRNIKYLRWEHDKLTPGFHWAEATYSRFGLTETKRRLNELPGVSGAHLKSHLEFYYSDRRLPSLSKPSLQRVLEQRGLRYVPDPKTQLFEIAKTAWVKGDIRVLREWTSKITSQIQVTHENLHLSSRREWDQLLHPGSLTLGADWRVECTAPSWTIYRGRESIGELSASQADRFVLYVSKESQWKSYTELHVPETLCSVVLKKQGFKDWLRINVRNSHQSHGTIRWALELPTGFRADSPTYFTSAVSRPLHNEGDASRWAQDVVEVFDTFYDHRLLSSGYGRWLIGRLTCAALPFL